MPRSDTDDQIREAKQRRAALLTKRERAQLERAVALLERIHERRCRAMGLHAEQGDDVDDGIAWPAHAGRAYLDELLDGDAHERKQVAKDLERLAFQTWLDSGAPMAELGAIARKGRS